MSSTCPTCGSELSDHDRHVRFRLPDAALDVPEEERGTRFWGNDVLLSIADLGSFVRALLPVHLDDGGSLTFGLWLGVHPGELERLWHLWWEPEYADVTFLGLVANDLAPWRGDVIGRQVSARVHDPESVPYVTGSDDPLVRRIVVDRWDADEVLPPFAHLL